MSDPWAILGRMDATRAQTPAAELIEWVQDALDRVTPGQFLLIEYLTDQDLPVDPYAQAALEPGGWYCELVSGHHLPTHRWPLDEVGLRRSGWLVPGDGTDNFWRPDVDLREAAGILVGSLWVGRSCTDPDRYALSVGTFPSGPHGGEPLPIPAGLPLAA
jgi:hypothetical protein